MSARQFFQVRLGDTGYEYACASDETLLEGAHRAGLALPYSCRKGACGSCRGRVESGTVDQEAGSGALSRAERDAGYVLCCLARPASHITLHAASVARMDPAARKTIKAKVYRKLHVSDDVTQLTLRCPAGVRLKFRAGQYLQMILPDGERRSFSMANPPQQSDTVELHIRHVPGGRYTEGVLASLQTGDSVEFETPFGDFYLREDTALPVVFVASGTGFAPIKSIVEDTIKRGLRRPMTIYWGARRRTDLYAFDLAQKWDAMHEHIRFVPVLSDEPVDTQPGMRSGLVHQAVMADLPSLGGVQVYACGAPAMTQAARADFTGLCDLSPDAFFCDAFVVGTPDPIASVPVAA